MFPAVLCGMGVGHGEGVIQKCHVPDEDVCAFRQIFCRLRNTLPGVLVVRRVDAHVCGMRDKGK